MLRLPDEIFIAGKMASGKDFVAARLLEADEYQRLPLALEVKKDIAAKYGITLEELELNKSKYRTDLQEHGNGCRGLFGKDYWLRRWEKGRAELFDAFANPRFVVTDCRYINEAQFGIQRGALVVRVVVPDEIRLRRLQLLYGTVTDEQLHHASEVEVDRLPCHLEISGQLPADQIVPTLEAGYLYLLAFVESAQRGTTEPIARILTPEYRRYLDNILSFDALATHRDDTVIALQHKDTNGA